MGDFHNRAQQFISFPQNFTDFAVTLLVGLPHKTLTTDGTRKYIILTVFLLLVSFQVCFSFEELVTLKTIKCGEKWRVSFLHMRFQVSFKSEGLFTLVTFLPLLLGDRMSFCNMSL